MYHFKREVVEKIFRSLLKKPNFQLPKPIMPEEVDRIHALDYYLYDYRIGKLLKKYFITFKDYLEHYYQIRAIVLLKEYLIEHSFRSIKMVFGDSSNLLVDNED